MLEFTSNPDLFKAIGRVAVESAQVDEMLREMISDLLPESADDVWILFEGQGSEWLSETFKTMLAHVDGTFRSWAREDHEEFRKLLGWAAQLRVLRNAVVHGTWREEITLGWSDGDDYIGRPWKDSQPGEKIFWCIRSRQRKGLQEREFSITDVERLAVEIAENRQRIADLFRKETETHPGAGDTLKRWPSVSSQTPAS
ncbi:hypothetical protein GCM10010211_22010 [Streptomyces albospinus]|uniref:Swt1-like HEPN domain-containing protein n=1 Tax=Streptomyces albospinus TaxID=285515 RepID=A0ABQ2UWA2_9ACTN|nr:hypothetical protein [Streptomyces albospinus]GGU56899.1 hypothetical protein GCM10010211_22010 [Streptomyces albospinus]